MNGCWSDTTTKTFPQQKSAKMVNPLMSSMSAKMEPIGSGMESGLEDSSSLVKMELENLESGNDDTSNKSIKMELDDLLGLSYCSSSILESDQLRMSDSDSKESLIGGDLLLGPPPSYSSEGLGGPLIRTVKVPQISDSFPPVLSIPGSSFVSLASTSLEISISPPSSAGPDTTTLTSPPPSSQAHRKQPAYTAKGAVTYSDSAWKTTRSKNNEL